jgi:hypothetical protein
MSMVKDAGGSVKQQLEAGKEADREAEKERQVSPKPLTLNPKP